ncbi:MAG: hypothetical protein LBD03_07645 [Methanobrevibacter sp.]|jgi:predicted  nucleic acid-binding Zn-ribbon protein|nr:hypothetical protein [Candidatus Methanovirga procula]
MNSDELIIEKLNDFKTTQIEMKNDLNKKMDHLEANQTELKNDQRELKNDLNKKIDHLEKDLKEDIKTLEDDYKDIKDNHLKHLEKKTFLR